MIATISEYAYCQKKKIKIFDDALEYRFYFFYVYGFHK